MLGWLKQKISGPAPALPAAADADALIAAAEAARERGDAAEAIRQYRDAHAAAPSRAYPLYWLATLLQDSGELKDAFAFGQRGLALDPDQIGLLLRMGSIAGALLDPVAALGFYQRAAQLDPDVPDIDALLADQLCHLGRVDEGIAAFDRALARNPESLKLAEARLFCLNFTNLLAPAALAREHMAWGQRVERTVQRLPPRAASGGAIDGKMRIGYVSPDLRDHAVSYFVAPLLERHDRNRFDVSVFDTSALPEDFMTARMQACVTGWHRVSGLSDDELAAAIQAAGIDILVDLSGHTKGNRLNVFARKPAPIQVTWLGYLGTTGLKAMDYRFTDAYMDPPGLTEALHCEELVRLPVHACFSPLRDTPGASPSPVAAGAALTFGSVNQWAKVSAETRDLWAAVLVRCPGARLHVIARGGHNPALQRMIAAEFARRGARADQVQVFPFMSTPDFLQFMARIDIALDPFPYGGGTTTMQCLWMGVPVVTLAGATPMARNSIGPLHGAGLSDLVAGSPSEYQEIAVRLGRDVARLAALRRDLRARMAASPLADGAGFARGVERAYETMRDRGKRASRTG